MSATTESNVITVRYDDDMDYFNLAEINFSELNKILGVNARNNAFDPFNHIKEVCGDNDSVFDTITFHVLSASLNEYNTIRYNTVVQNGKLYSDTLSLELGWNNAYSHTFRMYDLYYINDKQEKVHDIEIAMNVTLAATKFRKTHKLKEDACIYFAGAKFINKDWYDTKDKNCIGFSNKTDVTVVIIDDSNIYKKGAKCKDTRFVTKSKYMWCLGKDTAYEIMNDISGKGNPLNILNPVVIKGVSITDAYNILADKQFKIEYVRDTSGGINFKCINDHPKYIFHVVNEDDYFTFSSGEEKYRIIADFGRTSLIDWDHEDAVISASKKYFEHGIVFDAKNLASEGNEKIYGKGEDIIVIQRIKSENKFGKKPKHFKHIFQKVFNTKVSRNKPPKLSMQSSKYTAKSTLASYKGAITDGGLKALKLKFGDEAEDKLEGVKFMSSSLHYCERTGFYAKFDYFTSTERIDFKVIDMLGKPMLPKDNEVIPHLLVDRSKLSFKITLGFPKTLADLVKIKQMVNPNYLINK